MSKVKPLKTAIIGCGMICDSYFEPIIKNFSVLDIVGCADMIDSKAAEKAEKYNIKKMTVDEILADSEIELVLIALCNACGSKCYFSCDECFTSSFTFMIEENTVTAIHAVGLPIVFHDPKAIEFGYRIG